MFNLKLKTFSVTTFGILSFAFISSISFPTSVFALENNFTITHLASQMPVNTTSTGGISVCLTDSTGVEHDIRDLDKMQSTSLTLPAGLTTYYISSFTYSSADGSEIDPCGIESMPPQAELLTGSITLQENIRYNFDFNGQGGILDPRTSITNPSNDLYNPENIDFILPDTVNSRLAGLYVSYPDVFSSELRDSNNSVIYVEGPLSLTNQLCVINNGTPTLLTGSEYLSSPYEIYFGNIPVNTELNVYPVNVDGTCNDSTFSSTINVPANEDALLLYNSDYRLTGFSLDLVSSTPINTPNPTPVTPIVSSFSVSSNSSLFSNSSSNSSMPVSVSSSPMNNSTTSSFTSSMTSSNAKPPLVRTGGYDENKFSYIIGWLSFGLLVCSSFILNQKVRK